MVFVLLGGNYIAFKKACKLHNITIPSGKIRGDRKNKPKYSLEEIMVKNGWYNRVHLKRRLIESNILKNQCSECGLEPIWNKKKLSLQLDHINGIHNDDRLENLRLLCPNCHSQTENFAGRNTRKMDGD